MSGTLGTLAADPGTGDGKVVWATGVGGLGSDVSRDLAIHPAGGVVVCGDFEDTATFGKLGEHKVVGGSDAFAMAVGADGAPRWVMTLGGKNEETCDGIAVNKDGVTAFGGLFSDTIEVGKAKVTAIGSDDAYVAAVDADGAPAWLWTTGDKASDIVSAIIATPDGGFLAAGGFYGEAIFAEGLTLSATYQDAFLVKLSADGVVEWARRYGGDGSDRFVRLAIDGTGAIYAIASFDRSTSYGGETMQSAGHLDFALVKLDAAGNHLWSQRYGGPDNDNGVGLAVDPAGNVTLVGAFDKQIKLGDELYGAKGVSDVLLMRFSPDGKLGWSKVWGGPGEDIASGVAADAAGNVVVTGWFEQQIDLGQGPIKAAGKVGNKDIFVAKLDFAGEVRWARTLGDEDHDKGRGVALDGEGNAYVAGIFRFTLAAPTPIESVYPPGHKAPDTDAFVIRVER